MTDTLLRSLRERILDESEPLAGLLRKCLLLGAETGSVVLRDWARSELTGYGDEDELPMYRRLPSPPIKVDSISGNTMATGQIFNRLQIPADVREFVSEWFFLRQPIEELETLSKSPTLSFTTTGLAYAQLTWSRKLGPYQQITGMSYLSMGSTISGILGQIRTQLVEVISDLTMATPLAELPQKEKVDAAVNHHIGTQYITTIQTATGPTAIGTKAQASASNFSVDDALKLLEVVQRTATTDISDSEEKSELLSAIEVLRTLAKQEAPDTGEVVKRVGKLKVVADRIGVPTLGAAVGGVVEAFTTLSMSGSFG